LFKRLPLSLFIAKETGSKRETQSSDSWKWGRNLLLGAEYLSVSKKEKIKKERKIYKRK
jgi:hypothetical protein